jgi:hypothetical protein
VTGRASSATLERLTQPDWCNDPQPWNRNHACMRRPGHDGDHAVRKVYDLDFCLTWPSERGPVRSRPASVFDDLWDLRDDWMHHDAEPVGNGSSSAGDRNQP